MEMLLISANPPYGVALSYMEQLAIFIIIGGEQSSQQSSCPMLLQGWDIYISPYQFNFMLLGPEDLSSRVSRSA